MANFRNRFLSLIACAAFAVGLVTILFARMPKKNYIKHGFNREIKSNAVYLLKYIDLHYAGYYV
ncbi:MAG: hypothetical protein WCF67_14205, partial [Chitinophagaceae bacterium]